MSEQYGAINLSTANAVGATLNKKMGVQTGFAPKDWPDTVNLLVKLPTKTVSGAVASFEDGADTVPLSSCECAIVGKQLGTGDPSLSNYRDFSGVSSDTIYHTGRNLFGGTIVNYAYYGGKITSGSSYRSFYLKVIPGETYTISRTTVEGNRFRIYATIEKPAYNVSLYNLDVDHDSAMNLTVTIPTGYNWLFVYLSNQDSTCTVSNYMVEYGSTSHTVETYQGESREINFGTTVYGGSINSQTGVLKLTHAVYEISSDWSWKKSSTYNGSFYANLNSLPSDVDVKANTPFLCTHGLCVDDVANYVYGRCIVLASLNFWFMEEDKTVNNWKSFINTQRNNGTPIKIMCELETPIEIQLSVEELNSFYGCNNIWDSENNNTEVTYRRDIDLAIAQQAQNVSLQSVAPLMQSVAPTVEEQGSEEE